MNCKEIIAKRKELWDKYRSIEKDAEYIEAVAEYLTRAEAESLRQEIAVEPRLLIEMCFAIVDKEKKTIPLFLNEVQRDFSDDLYKAIDDHRKGDILSVRFLVLKGRQQGFTVYITAEQLARSLVQKNFSGFTIADCTDNTHAIFEDKAKFPYEHLPERLKPTEKYNNRKELHFQKLNSKWRVATASKDIGRSKTVNFFHGSEAAFWEVLISDIQAAIGEALTSDAIQILESTANGYNEFKDAWDSGKWINKFYEWWRTKEYRQNFENQAKERNFKHDVETNKGWIYDRCRWLVETIGLDWQQVYWYFNKWDNYIDKEKIKQEYPCSPDEAFLASGRCVFDKEKIIMRKEVLKRKYEKEPYRVGRFSFIWNDPETKDKILDESIKWVDDPNGCIRLYEDKKQGYPYVLGGDTKGEGTDFYSGTVINNVTGNRCAVIHMQLMHSKPYTWQVYCMGKYFNTALIGIEMNFNTSPIEELERLHYPRQYQRQKYDDFTGAYKKAYGWKTDGNTRPLIIDKEISMIENHIDLFNDIPMLDECLTFVEDENGRPDAEEGKHDDILISDMIGEEIRKQQTREIEKNGIMFDYEYEEGDDEYKEMGESFFD